MAYCKNCGTALKAESNFCENCRHSSHEATPEGRSSPQGAAANSARIAAVVVLIGFFLPWVSCPGLTGNTQASGLDLANHGESALWIIPLSALIALGVLLNKGKSLRERASRAKIVAAAGLASVAIILYYWASFNGIGQRDELGLNAVARQTSSIEVGGVLSLLGSVVLAVCGFLHHPSRSQLESSTKPFSASG